MENNTVAIVTGSSSGLGLELCLGLAKANYKVLGVSRRSPQDSRWSDQPSDILHHIEGDVSAEGFADDVFSHAEQIGSPNLLINCAGVGVFGPVGSNDRAKIDSVIAGTLIGTILFCEAALRRFDLERGGKIVNVMSTAATVGRPNESIYCASKWGARGYTEALRLEAKKSFPKVNVIAVYPGGMNTRFWETAIGANVDSSKFMDPKQVAQSVIDSIGDRPGMYISDIHLNRS